MQSRVECAIASRRTCTLQEISFYILFSSVLSPSIVKISQVIPTNEDLNGYSLCSAQLHGFLKAKRFANLC